MLRWLFGKKMSEARARAEERLGAGSIVFADDTANYFGIESAGGRQLRGNGLLAASEDTLIFIRWYARGELLIPRDRITGIERVRGFAGKTIGRQLLKVSFTTELGEPEAAAWYVHDLPAWESTLNR